MKIITSKTQTAYSYGQPRSKFEYFSTVNHHLEFQKSLNRQIYSSPQQIGSKYIINNSPQHYSHSNQVSQLNSPRSQSGKKIKMPQYAINSPKSISNKKTQWSEEELRDELIKNNLQLKNQYQVMEQELIRLKEREQFLEYRFSQLSQQQHNNK